MAPWFKYSAVRVSDVEDKALDGVGPERAPPSKTGYRSHLNGVLLFVLGLGLGLMISMVLRWPPRWSIYPKPASVPSRHGYDATKIVDGELIEGTQCGDSWEEAKALGCIYDKMASRWYAPECFDQVSFDAMMEEPGTNFTWFQDKEHTIQVPRTVGQSGEWNGLLYPMHDFHKIHCLYLWRKMHHALLNNLPLDDDLMAEDHTIHCTKNLLTWPDPDVKEVASIARAGRPFCRRNPLGVVPLGM